MNNSSQPLISVVTPVYNGAEHLAECIESVLAQTYQNWDYTIVDNCSTDGSVEIARRYAAKDRRIRFGRISSSRVQFRTSISRYVRFPPRASTVRLFLGMIGFFQSV